MPRSIRLAIVAALIGTTPLASAAAQPADPTNGHRLAVKICSACHVVAPDQDFPPLLRNPAPSFKAIANRKGTTTASLQKFIETTHAGIATPANMPNPMLTEDQAQDIASYIVSLRSRSRR
jgi:mono/diheme cytochrome c family protein